MKRFVSTPSLIIDIIIPLTTNYTIFAKKCLLFFYMLTSLIVVLYYMNSFLEYIRHLIVEGKMKLVIK